MKYPLLILLPVAIAGFTSCSSVNPESTAAAKVEHGVPGGQIVQTSKITATVTGIDAAKRKLTLVTPEGTKRTVTASSAVVNFPQIRIGDQLKVTLVEELVVRMAGPGENTRVGSEGLIALAPVGAKPGAASAEVAQATATVTAINHKKHRATLKFPDGSSETVDVRQDVDLSKRSVGEKVVVRYTEIFAVLIEKP